MTKPFMMFSQKHPSTIPGFKKSSESIQCFFAFGNTSIRNKKEDFDPGTGKLFKTEQSIRTFVVAPKQSKTFGSL
jgi:hypothetical protein